MLHARDLVGVVQVDGQQYEWRLQREPQWCSADGWKGMSIVVRQADAQREAILEFPMPAPRRSRLQPQSRRPQISQQTVESAVRSALEAGWDPNSRGKAVVFEVDAKGR